MIGAACLRAGDGRTVETRFSLFFCNYFLGSSGIRVKGGLSRVWERGDGLLRCARKDAGAAASAGAWKSEFGFGDVGEALGFEQRDAVDAGDVDEAVAFELTQGA